jgi:hypothetical protein
MKSSGPELAQVGPSIGGSVPPRACATGFAEMPLMI